MSITLLVLEHSLSWKISVVLLKEEKCADSAHLQGSRRDTGADPGG